MSAPKPIKEAVEGAGDRPSWPAPWLTGEHTHAIWRELVARADLPAKRVSAELFIRETEMRFLSFMVSSGMNSSPAGTASGERDDVNKLESYLIKIYEHYYSVFGEPCPGSEGYRGNSPHPAIVSGEQGELFARDGAQGPPPLKRSREAHAPSDARRSWMDTAKAAS